MLHKLVVELQVRQLLPQVRQTPEELKYPEGQDVTQEEPERRSAGPQERQLVALRLQVRQVELHDEQEDPERNVPSGQVLRQVRL